MAQGVPSSATKLLWPIHSFLLRFGNVNMMRRPSTGTVRFVVQIGATALPAVTVTGTGTSTLVLFVFV